jgi:hypothetical protein
MLMRKVVLVQESAWVSWLLGPVPSDEAEPPAALRPGRHLSFFWGRLNVAFLVIFG